MIASHGEQRKREQDLNPSRVNVSQLTLLSLSRRSGQRLRVTPFVAVPPPMRKALPILLPVARKR